MTAQQIVGVAPAAQPRRRLKLGFNARISFSTGQERRGLRDGIELFRVAEQLGYDTGWVYQRHFDNYLASPLVLHAAIAEHTDRIGLGTAIIGIRYEQPILLAEAAATADLLSDGRLQLGLGTGQGGYDGPFGRDTADGRAVSADNLDRLLAAVRGEAVGAAAEPDGMVPAGTPLTVRPHSPGLADRVWYGAGSVASAVRVAERGLNLLLSTILSGRIDDYGAELARAIDGYRQAYAGAGTPRVGVARSVLPATSPELARRYAAYDAERRTQGPAASRPHGALPTAAAPSTRFTMSPVHHGWPGQVVEQLLVDPSVALSDELIAFLPPAFSLADNIRLLTDIATQVAGSLGWAAPDSRELEEHR